MFDSELKEKGYGYLLIIAAPLFLTRASCRWQIPRVFRLRMSCPAVACRSATQQTVRTPERQKAAPLQVQCSKVSTLHVAVAGVAVALLRATMTTTMLARPAMLAVPTVLAARRPGCGRAGVCHGGA